MKQKTKQPMYPSEPTEPIVCTQCGVIDDYSTEPKSNQLTARCNSCKAFFKNISYAPAKFYVGKYKGTLIADCIDKQYMIWYAEIVAKGKLKKDILKRISEL